MSDDGYTPGGQPSYGQPSYGQPSYGQSSYGQAGPSWSQFSSAPAQQVATQQYTADGVPLIFLETRPATVTAAAVVAMVFSGIAIIATVVIGFLLTTDRDGVRQQILDSDSWQTREHTGSVDRAMNYLIGIDVAVFVVALVSAGLGFLVLRRSNAARIALTVLAGAGIIPAALASFGLIGIPWLAAMIVTIVLLYVGGANDWFARRSPLQAQLGYGYPPYRPM
jgi:hypothetical protein